MEMISRQVLAEAPAATGALKLTCHSDLGLVHIVGCGFWTVDYIRDHFETLHQLVQDMRQRTPHVLALVDLSGAPVQAPGTAEEIRIATGRIYQAADRIAIVQNSALLSLQIRRVVDNDKLKIFGSAGEALAWLGIDAAAIDCSSQQ